MMQASVPPAPTKPAEGRAVLRYALTGFSEARQREEQARQREEQARQREADALRRVAELEAELRRR